MLTITRNHSRVEEPDANLSLWSQDMIMGWDQTRRLQRTDVGNLHDSEGDLQEIQQRSA